MKPKSRRFSNRKPESISSILESAMGRRRLDKEVEKHSAFPMWPEIVGEELAAVTKPEKIISGKVLVVRVADAVWAQELSLQKSWILERLKEKNTGAIIQDIRFTIGNPKLFSDPQQT